MRSILVATLAFSAGATACADGIQWVASYEEGVRLAAASGKLLMVAFFAEG